MQIKLSEDVINKADLIEIIDYIKVCKGQHTLATEKNKRVIAELKNDPHYVDLYRVLLEKSANGIIFSNCIEVVKDNPGVGQVAVGQLYALLKEAAVLIVENEHNDKRFIETVLHCLNSRRLIKNLGKYWKIRGAGGCGDIPKLIVKVIEENDNASRVSVVHDSDKFWPKEPLEQAQTNIVDCCRKENIKCVTLKKREIENYIIDRVIVEIKSIESSLKTAFFTLSQQQKNHYDYKIGFKNLPANDKRYQGLFNNLTDDVIAALHNGLDSKIADSAFASEMYIFYTEQALNDQCKQIIREFKKIESTIMDML
jgi:hypothetical protein